MTAHNEVLTIRLRCLFPPHIPRTSDTHYRWFEEARARLKKSGKLVCWINNHDCQGEIQLHHALIEYALINDVDIEKFKHLYPEFHVLNDEDFYRVVESEGALTCLCFRHHIGDLGIHVIPYPGWVVQRVLKDGVEPPVEKERKEKC
jgi:hypothetical protein